MSQFVSYAQNFEDVMLWRALKHVQNGFYVDVGANDPKLDSVTRAFYERGWRGINIEPMQSYYEALCRERPEDINLNVAVGATEGNLTFFEVPGTGISSVVADSVFDNKFLEGRQVIARRVPSTSLNKLFEEHVRGEIHFLKIDVEGYEKVVFEGLDLSRWRPWILLGEATYSNSSELNESFPESMIVSSGYSFVYFDGLNRYYVANEHPELVDAFSAPPNVFDYFTLYSQVKANAENETTRQELERVRKELEDQQIETSRALNEIEAYRKELDLKQDEARILSKKLEYAIKESETLRKQVEASKVIAEALKKEAEASKKEAEALKIEAETMRREYVNILYSFSYRVTAPLRFVYVQTQKLRVRARQLISRSPQVVQVYDMSVSSGAKSPDFVENETYFLGFFQREINRRQKELRDQKS